MDKYFLREYIARKREIEQLEERLNRMRAEITTAKAPIISDLPKSGSRKLQDERIAIVLDLEQFYISKIKKLAELQKQIEKAFDSLESIERMLMRARYIEGKSWEEIAVMLHYTYRHITRLHGEILLKL